MALETFTPPKAPKAEGGEDQQVSLRARRADFGDGYSQRAGDGLNATKRTVSLTWSALSVDDADAIEEFLFARGGYQAFLYEVPELTAELKWVCGGWSRVPEQPGIHTITATFEQVYDL